MKSPYQLKREKIEREAAKRIGASMRDIMSQLAFIDNTELIGIEIDRALCGTHSSNRAKWIKASFCIMDLTGK